MSNRCKLQKEYYKGHKNYKSNGVYNDGYVKWLEDELIALKQSDNVVLDDVIKRFDCTECEDSGVNIAGMDCTSCEKTGL